MPAIGSLLGTAEAAARLGGETIRSASGTGGRSARVKSAGDYVTEVDEQAELAIREALEQRTPKIPVVGEETGGADEGWAAEDRYWLVDPLDGTTNFIHGFPAVAVSVALIDNGRPVVGAIHAPFLGLTYSAAEGAGATLELDDGTRTELRVADRPIARAVIGTGFPFRRKDVLPRYYRMLRRALDRFEDLRRPGAAALDLAWVAAGVFDGFFELALGPWDVAAGALLIHEAGGIVTDWSGRPDYLTGNILAGPKPIHEELLRLAAETED